MVRKRFSGFFEEESVMKRPGDFTAADQNKMLISVETRLGLLITGTFSANVTV